MSTPIVTHVIPSNVSFQNVIISYSTFANKTDSLVIFENIIPIVTSIPVV